MTQETTQQLGQATQKVERSVTATSQQKPAIQQSGVQYTAGQTNFAPSGYGLLEWTAEGRIRLFDVDHEAKKTTNLLFDISPQEIKKARTSLSFLDIWFNGAYYNIDFSNTAMPLALAGGILGVAQATKVANKTDIVWWVENLEKQGVKVSDMNIFGKNGGKIWAWTIGGVVAFTVFLFFLFLFAASSA